MALASRVAKIKPFHVMKLLARARELEAEGKSIIHMEIGEPDFITPKPVLDAAHRAISDGKVHYTPALGLPELRLAISDYYQQQFHLNIPANRIIITSGASGALLLVMGLLVEQGQKVMMTDPGYPCNKHFTEFVNATAKLVPVSNATNFQLTPELLEQYWDSDVSVVILASPSNPSGTFIPEQDLISIANTVAAKGASLVIDEIYQRLNYGSSNKSILSFSNDAFVVNSFSKYFNMTGWRLGWIVVPDDEAIINGLDNLSQNLFLAPPTIAQYAALAAFNPQTSQLLEQNRIEFQTRRDYLYQALLNIGFKIPVKPQGAFYIYADCSHFSSNSEQFCSDLLEQIGVAITPGIDFGVYKSRQHVRFAYTTSMDNLQQGINRLSHYLS
ncbi:Valine--pyruvate aminotransferase [hydrothermal vent metagenome]|uniref:Valine--pyruvate aminotransferase n=1 Tax=hydrothermal vent metagenome TaxID=652676 RepID=A0A3B1A6Q6_9ZZZZ